MEPGFMWSYLATASHPKDLNPQGYEALHTKEYCFSVFAITACSLVVFSRQYIQLYRLYQTEHYVMLWS